MVDVKKKYGAQNICAPRTKNNGKRTKRFVRVFLRVFVRALCAVAWLVPKLLKYEEFKRTKIFVRGAQNTFAAGAHFYISIEMCACAGVTCRNRRRGTV